MVHVWKVMSGQFMSAWNYKGLDHRRLLLLFNWPPSVVTQLSHLQVGVTIGGSNTIVIVSR